jgi:lipopolysaccharide export system permease protein
MVKFIDRQLVRSFFKAYFVCLVSMLSLYIVVDLFTKLDEFTSHNNGFPAVVVTIAKYYGYKIPAIFDRLCEVVVLLAAMFTIAWMQRNNELLPLLSAGVSMRRIVLPLITCACIMLSFAVLNQEFVIPQLGDRILVQADDPDGEKVMYAGGRFESNRIQIAGDQAVRKDMVVRRFDVLLRMGSFCWLHADEARYIPPNGQPQSGGWRLTGTKPAYLSDADLPIAEGNEPAPIVRINDGVYFVYTKNVDFESLTRPETWYKQASTTRLFQELGRTDSTRQAPIAVLFHMHFTRPLLGILLVVMGLATILRDQNRNVFLSAGLCLALCGLFFTIVFVCQALGDHHDLSAPLAAWLPVLFFGPLSLVMFDMVHT